MNETEFQQLIWEKSREHYRDMPWRKDIRPYYVLVSELMLQQTQVDRVIPKFHDFIVRFPDETALAGASMSEVLTLWSGLGYNRRAKFLHQSAQMIESVYSGSFPDTIESLLHLPGVGKGTAGAIMNYAFNKPTVFIETNVRTVYLHHFFPAGDIVSDRQIEELVKRTLDDAHPREFYWAIMDYGTWLKRNGASRLTQSKHYKKQPPLKGSVREVRGLIMKALSYADMPEAQLRNTIKTDERYEVALAGLMNDGLVERTKKTLHLTK